MLIFTALCCAISAGLSGCIFDGAADLEVAWSALRKGDSNQAIRLSSRAINFGGLSGEKLGSAYECRASANTQKAEYTRALSDLDKLVELRPDYAGGYLTRAETLFRAREVDRALTDIDRGLQIADPTGEKKDGHLAKRYVSRGNIRLAKKDSGGALTDFDHALSLDPASLDARMGRSHVLEARGQKREALVEMELVWQVVSKRVFMPISRQSVYLRRVIELRMANGFDPATPADVLPAEAVTIPAAAKPGEAVTTGSTGSSDDTDTQPDEVSEKNLDSPLLGQ